MSWGKLALGLTVMVGVAFAGDVLIRENRGAVEKMRERFGKRLLNANPQERSLERRCTESEERVKKLEKLIYSQSKERGNWENTNNWQGALRKAMTKNQVHQLMGEPDNIDIYPVVGDAWWYGNGRIDFSQNGRVESWREPNL
jgi:hypothetical protein